MSVLTTPTLSGRRKRRKTQDIAEVEAVTRKRELANKKLTRKEKKAKQEKQRELQKIAQ